MAPIVIGDRAFRIRVAHRAGVWTAHAARADNGDRFGPGATADSEVAAVRAVVLWLEWQQEHAAALEALQSAERTYHRALAGEAFAAGGDVDASRRARRDALESMEEAQARLDVVRNRRPQ